jgi:hypothetical protein
VAREQSQLPEPGGPTKPPHSLGQVCKRQVSLLYTGGKGWFVNSSLVCSTILRCSFLDVSQTVVHRKSQDVELEVDARDRTVPHHGNPTIDVMRGTAHLQLRVLHSIRFTFTRRISVVVPSFDEDLRPDGTQTFMLSGG